MDKITRTLRFKSWLVTKIEELADKENRTFNNMVETILEKAVNRNSNTDE